MTGFEIEVISPPPFSYDIEVILSDKRAHQCPLSDYASISDHAKSSSFRLLK